jgi:hypothetical protein
MNKGYIILIIIIAITVGYGVLNYTGNLTAIQTWFTGLTGWFTALGSNISGYLQGVNTFIKENTWVTPVLGVCGSLTAAGIVKVLANRSQAKVVSSLQNESMQTQNSITQTYTQSLSGLQTENQSLQTQLTETQTKLASIPNMGEIQAALLDKEKQVETLRGQIQLLQNTIIQGTATVIKEPVYK